MWNQQWAENRIVNADKYCEQLKMSQNEFGNNQSWWFAQQRPQ